MAEESCRKEDQVVAEATTPWGWGAKFRGSNQLLLVLFSMVLMFALLVMYIGYNEAAAHNREMAAIQRDVDIKVILSKLAASTEKQTQNQEIMIYVLTRNDKQRQALNLDEPRALRDLRR